MTEHRLSRFRVEELTSNNAAMQRCLQLATLAARTDIPVLILGRTGTGKTLLAQAIHNSSARSTGPFISFNASAMSDTLLESQLFGHERGAFTARPPSLRSGSGIEPPLFFSKAARGSRRCRPPPSANAACILIPSDANDLQLLIARWH